MDAAAQHAEVKGVVAPDGHEHVVGQHVRVEELEMRCFAVSTGGDVALQPGKCIAAVLAEACQRPTSAPRNRASRIRVALRLHAGENMLIDSGERCRASSAVIPKKSSAKNITRRVC